MEQWIVTVFYLGGMIPAYRAARSNGRGLFSSVLIDAIWWPADIGWHLAMRYCADDKE